MIVKTFHPMTPRIACLSSLIIFLASTGLASLQTEERRPALPVIPSGLFKVTDFGTKGDGMTLDTVAIQKAIDSCIRSGGGTVKFPSGNYLSGPLTLGSRVRLHLDKDSVLRISNDIPSYPKEGNRCLNSITADGASDLEISGEGTIDGQGEPWWKGFRADKAGFVHRPFLIVLKDCTRVLVKGVRLVNSPSFHLVPQLCTDVTIDGVTITSPADSPNTDAIDPSGWNYLITRCQLDVGDDNIAVKAGGDRKSPGNRPSCTNFTVTDCTFLHGHGLSIGSETYGGMDGMTVRNCTFDGTTSGIRMKSNRERGGLVRNLRYEGIRMNNVKTPVSITSYYPKTPAKPSDDPVMPVKVPAPEWKNIEISNMTVTGSKSAGVIWGLPELPVIAVTFRNVSISAETGMKVYNALDIRFIDSSLTVKKGEKIISESAEIRGVRP